MTNGHARAGVAGPELCVVVLSYRSERTIVAAVESLLEQEEPLEIVVSHSGAGPTPELLRRRFPWLRIVSSRKRRLPGAARNAGVAASRAPYVAFLPGDSRAEPGWAAARAARHRAGAEAVASVMAPAEGGLAPLASQLLQHSDRLPGVRAPQHYRFGLSYSRAVLEKLGGFREDLELAEDGELNGRMLRAGVPIDEAPDVLTSHAYPATVSALLRDQYVRGRRRAAAGGDLRWRLAVLARACIVAPVALWRAARAGSIPRGALVRAAPLVVAGAIAKAVGAARNRGTLAGAFAERDFHRWVAGERRRRARRPLDVLLALSLSDLRARYGRGPLRLLKWLLESFAMVGVFLLFVTLVLDRPGRAPGLSIACAIVPFQFVMLTVLNASDALRMRASILANMAFPRTLIPLASALTEAIALGSSVVLLAIMMAASQVAPTIAVLWLPVAVAAMIALAVALAYPASLLALWLPDLRPFTPSVFRAMFFLAPGVVALEQIPGLANTLVRLNPLTPVFELFRDALLYGHSPAAWQVLYPLALAAFMLAVFVPIYHREQRHFAKVLVT